MNNPPQDDDPKRSLAIDPPQPMVELPRSVELGLGAITLGVAGVGACVLIAGSMTPCMGATRSAKLEWQRRHLRIERAERVLLPTEGFDERSDAIRLD